MSIYLPTSLVRGNSDATILLDDEVRPIIKEYIISLPEELNFQAITNAGTYDPQVGALTTGPITLEFGGYNTLKLANSNTGRPGINFYDYTNDKNSTLILEQSSLTADQQVQLPDASGTLVVNESTLPFQVNNAPITMSWSNFESIKLSPTAASGAPGSHISFIDHNSENVATLAAPQDGSLNGNRNFVFPDVSGTLAIKEHSPSGTKAATGTATTTYTVTIPTQSNSTYTVSITPLNTLSAALCYVTNKTTTAFDVVYLVGLTGAVSFDWQIQR